MDPMQRLLDEAIQPRVEEIAPILVDSDVAVVFFEIAKSVRAAARRAGWTGARSKSTAGISSASKNWLGGSCRAIQPPHGSGAAVPAGSSFSCTRVRCA